MARIRFLVVLLGLVASATPIMAGDVPPLIDEEGKYTIGQHDLRLDFNLDGSVLRGDWDDGTVDFRFGVSYFALDWLAPGFECSALDVAGGNTAGGFLFTTRGYYPTKDRVLPYAGVGLGYRQPSLGGRDIDTFNLMLQGGVDFLLTPNVAIGVELRYDLMAGDDTTVHEVSFPIGLRIYFGGLLEGGKTSAGAS